MIWTLSIAFVALVALITAYLTRHYLFTLAALYHKSEQPPEVNETTYEPAVSVMIPAHNEEQVIERILQRMTELTYPKEKLEVIVIDDASTDKTGKKAKRFAKNHKFIHFVQRNQTEGGNGKPEALNYGLKHVSGEIIYCFDADYYPQRDIIEKLTVCFKNPKVGAVQGRVTVLNEPDSIVTRLVALERTGGYRVDQFARNELELISQFGGTVGGFRKNLIETLGGWDPNILAEDTDLTFRIYLAGFKIKYVNSADCYEEAVENWGSYWRQRSRWAKGHMQCAFRHVWPVIRSKKMSLREKVDGFLLLNVYFVPILATLAWIIGAVLFLVEPIEWVNVLWMMLPISFYSSVGNFAPFFEVGIGAYLDGRDRICWLIPMLFLTFMLNVLICTKAFIDLCFSRITGKKRHTWSKTVHKGNGSQHIN
ncbi:MAG: glycosyltransferase family 2 protein [Candidatus Bathyarchaeota archaeon]|nr:glycosyltransferase family 2 protein [Candidatus Bathyarchaeum sp.]